MQHWDPLFSARSPMLEPIARYAAPLRESPDWPPRESLDGLLRAARVANARGLALRAVAPDSARTVSYERGVHDHGQLEVRERGWHDLFNVLAWCAFPEAKAALNACHVAAARAEAAAANRGTLRDALTLFDESGAIVVSTERDLLDELRAFRWKRLFVNERERVRRSLRVYLFGHAVLQKALAPYVGLSAHAITLHVKSVACSLADVDVLAAREIAAVTSPLDLAPLPVLGVPGWWEANEEETFYDNTAYFRPGRTRT